MVDKFPKKLFVMHEGEGDERYLAANEDIAAFADIFDVRRVGVYVLQETVKVSTTVTTKKVMG